MKPPSTSSRGAWRIIHFQREVSDRAEREHDPQVLHAEVDAVDAYQAENRDQSSEHFVARFRGGPVQRDPRSKSQR